MGVQNDRIQAIISLHCKHCGERQEDVIGRRSWHKQFCTRSWLSFTRQEKETNVTHMIRLSVSLKRNRTMTYWIY